MRDQWRIGPSDFGPEAPESGRFPSVWTRDGAACFDCRDSTAVPDMAHDCRHDDHAAREVGDGWRLAKQTHTHATASGVSSVLISAFSVAETI